MAKKRPIGAAVLAIVSLTGCAPGTGPGETSEPRAVNALVGAVRSEPRTFNRLLARDSTSSLVATLTHGKLFRINPTTDGLEPWLAESSEVSTDGLRHTINLRRGVRFSDGTPLSSADVVFSFDAVYDGRLNSPLRDALEVDGQPLEAIALDDYSVEVRFPAPYSPGLRLLDNLPILPRHRLLAALSAGSLDAEWGVAAPLDSFAGLGPFVLEAYEPGVRLTFRRNDYYWRQDERGRRLPLLDRLILEIIPDQDAEMLRLEAGEIDFATNAIRLENYARLREAAAAGTLQLFELGVSLDADFLWFNLGPRFDNDPRRAWLRSAAFRQAVAFAIDRQAVANVVYLGLAEPAFGPVTPGNRRWFSPDAPRYPYDTTRAASLLEGLRLVDHDGDGVREDEAGVEIQFTMLTQRGNSARERAARLVQEDLRAVGIAVEVAELEFGALIDRITRGDYESAYFGVRASDTDPAVNLDFWLSSGSFHLWNPGQSTPATDWERAIDELMRQQVAASDFGERKRLFDEVQRVFGEYLPAIYTVAPYGFFVTSTRVGNAEPVALQPHLLWNADRLALRARSDAFE